MAQVIYNPKYSIDKINANFAKLGSQTSLSNFIANNFTPSTTTKSSVITKPIPVDMNLVYQVFQDYGNGPVGEGLKQSLTLINDNVMIGDFTNNGDIFNNLILYGANIDFRYVTLGQGEEIVLKNLQLFDFIPYIELSYKNTLYSSVDSIVNDIKVGQYEYDNYLVSVLAQSRTIAKQLITLYG